MYNEALRFTIHKAVGILIILYKKLKLTAENACIQLHVLHSIGVELDLIFII